jgi:hypothetical protein
MVKMRTSIVSDIGSYPLLGTYTTPELRLGDHVRCRIRGEVEIIGLTSALIPWPIGKRSGKRGRPSGLVLCDGLVEALHSESISAVCRWWGVNREAVRRWRAVLGLKGMTEGTRTLKIAVGRRTCVSSRGTKASPESE